MTPPQSVFSNTVHGIAVYSVLYDLYNEILKCCSHTASVCSDIWCFFFLAMSWSQLDFNRGTRWRCDVEPILWSSFSLVSSPTDIEVACYGYEGIDAVKEALRAGLGCSTEAMPIKVFTAALSPGPFFVSVWTPRGRAAVVRLNALFLCLADQPDRSPPLRDDHDHSGAHGGPVRPQPGHGGHQGEDWGEEGRL